MSFKQSNIRKIYRQWAKTYEWLTPIYLLGNEAKLRKKTIQALNLRSEQLVRPTFQLAQQVNRVGSRS